MCFENTPKNPTSKHYFHPILLKSGTPSGNWSHGSLDSSPADSIWFSMCFQVFGLGSPFVGWKALWPSGGDLQRWFPWLRPLGTQPVWLMPTCKNRTNPVCPASGAIHGSVPRTPHSLVFPILERIDFNAKLVDLGFRVDLGFETYRNRKVLKSADRVRRAQ